MDRYQSWEVTKATGAMFGMFGGVMTTVYGLAMRDVEATSAGMSMVYRSHRYLFSDSEDLENRTSETEHLE